ADAETERTAGLLLRAMVAAASCDGRIDAEERRKILAAAAQAGADRTAVTEAFERPLPPEALAREVPAGRERQVYAVSALVMDPDTPVEARYLDALARALGLGQMQVNAIHAQLGQPPLYA